MYRLLIRIEYLLNELGAFLSYRKQIFFLEIIFCVLFSSNLVCFQNKNWKRILY